ncbi:MAG: hypothetical protein GY820_17285 [Gammaproteobacteria bacterium]|nr:hypothetical protein [Gammaproteobacteria bacterium]
MLIDRITLEKQIIRIVGRDNAQKVFELAQERAKRATYFYQLQKAVEDLENGKMDNWMEAE